MKKFILPLTILLMLALIIVGCSKATPTATTSPSAPAGQPSVKPPASTTASKYGGTLTIITNALPVGPIGMPQESLGPSLESMKYTEETPMTQSLVGKLGFKMAESADYDMNPDHSGITIHLKKGIKFSDGSDFNAQAMKWNLDQLQKYMLYGGTSNWKSWDVVDDYTVKITYKEWRNSMFTDMVEGSMSFMVSPTAWTKNGEDWMKWNMVGTGPFLQKDFQRDASMTLVRNPGYWQQGKPYLDGIKLLYVTDETTGEATLQSGGADVLYGATAKQASDLKKAGFNIISRTEGTSVLVPDGANADSPWSNPLVRQAAEYALDKANLAKIYGYGYWKDAYEVASPLESLVYDPNFPGRKYDPNKAKQLLTQAGFPTGFKTKLIAPSGTNRDMMVSMQSDLGKVGIQADIDMPEMAKFNDYCFGSGWDNGLVYTTFFDSFNMNNALVFFTGDVGYGSMFVKTMYHPANWNQTLINSMRATLADPTVPVGDPAQFKQIMTTISDNAMVLPITYGASLSVTTNKVQDLGLYQVFRNWCVTPEDAWLSK